MAAVLYNVANRFTSGLTSTKLWKEKSKESQQAATPYSTDSVSDTTDAHRKRQIRLSNREKYTNININTIKKIKSALFSPKGFISRVF
jgi:hypothetical protein